MLKTVGILGVGVRPVWLCSHALLYAHMLEAILSLFRTGCGYSYRLSVVRASSGLLGALTRA